MYVYVCMYYFQPFCVVNVTSLLSPNHMLVGKVASSERARKKLQVSWTHSTRKHPQ